MHASVQICLHGIGRKVPTISFMTDFGNARGGVRKDGSNTCEVPLLS